MTRTRPVAAPPEYTAPQGSPIPLYGTACAECGRPALVWAPWVGKVRHVDPLMPNCLVTRLENPNAL